MSKEVLCIKSENPKMFWCKRCNKAHSTLYKYNGESWCEECVTEDIKIKAVTVNQNRCVL